MNYSVVKTGAGMFDALHAYGLGVLLAFVTQSSIRLESSGVCYRLHSPYRHLPDPDVEALYSVLALPVSEALEADQDHPASDPVEIANLDGLLAALFTKRGVRLASVADVLNRQDQRPKSAEKSLAKAQRAIERWVKYIKRISTHSTSWLSEMLQDYDAANPTIPSLWHKRSRDLSIVMTLDPAFSYSTRRVIRDGLITRKTNLAFRETRYATLLALIGAARFLRAQRVAGQLVNYYVPLPRSVTLYPDTALPSLRPVGYPSAQALALQWLRYGPSAHSEVRWDALAYQVMQTQGIQQSISRDRGCIGYAWLSDIDESVRNTMVDHWVWLLEKYQEQLPLEINDLADCLTARRAASWLAHLRDKAIYLQSEPRGWIRPYNLEEVREVTAAMNTSTADVPLSAVLERDQGTLRFGHALRLLGQYNPAPLRDITGALDTVRNRNQLLRLMAQAAQECAVASAKTEFIIIPNDDDLKYLLDDVDQYGAETIAGLLIILSTLRYPRKAEEETADESTEATQSGSIEEEVDTDDVS